MRKKNFVHPAFHVGLVSDASTRKHFFETFFVDKMSLWGKQIAVVGQFVISSLVLWTHVLAEYLAFISVVHQLQEIDGFEPANLACVDHHRKLHTAVVIFVFPF